MKADKVKLFNIFFCYTSFHSNICIIWNVLHLWTLVIPGESCLMTVLFVPSTLQRRIVFKETSVKNITPSSGSMSMAVRRPDENCIVLIDSLFASIRIMALCIRSRNTKPPPEAVASKYKRETYLLLKQKLLLI